MNTPEMNCLPTGQPDDSLANAIERARVKEARLGDGNAASFDAFITANRDNLPLDALPADIRALYWSNANGELQAAYEGVAAWAFARDAAHAIPPAVAGKTISTLQLAKVRGWFDCIPGGLWLLKAVNYLLLICALGLMFEFVSTLTGEAVSHFIGGQR
jgi:hypothetical protein